jgi:hypothetical protein
MEITKQELQEMMAKTVAAVVSEMKKPNAIEQKALDEAENASKRRQLLMKTLGKAEEESMRRKRYGCSHSRYSNAAGRLAGHSAPRGTGEWTTGGQTHGNGTITVICMRCATDWTYKGTPEEYQSAQDAGLLGVEPPPPERWILTCGYCNTEFTGEKKYRDHIEKCEFRPKTAA